MSKEKEKGRQMQDKVFPEDAAPSSKGAGGVEEEFEEEQGMNQEAAVAEAVHSLVGQDLLHPECLTDVSSEEIHDFALAEAAYEKLQSPMLRRYLDYQYKLRASKDRQSRHEVADVSKSLGRAEADSKSGAAKTFKAMFG